MRTVLVIDTTISLAEIRMFFAWIIAEQSVSKTMTKATAYGDLRKFFVTHGEYAIDDESPRMWLGYCYRNFRGKWDPERRMNCSTFIKRKLEDYANRTFDGRRLSWSDDLSIKDHYTVHYAFFEA
jgi:hypothetical protein